MWIRSQNKQRIIKCEEITIDYLNGKFNDEQLKMLNTSKCWGLKTKHHVLGFYSTEEKALKVLDMIQEKICGMNKIFQSNELYDHTQRIDERFKEGIYLHNLHPDIYPESNITYIPKPLFFQMPNDDEV